MRIDYSRIAIAKKVIKATYEKGVTFNTGAQQVPGNHESHIPEKQALACLEPDRLHLKSGSCL